MAITRRYQPNWPPAESSIIGMDFAPMLPPGIAITEVTLDIVLNQSPTIPTTDFTQGVISIDGRRTWCLLAGGNAGVDYQCRWHVTDSIGQNWIRTALLLCAETS